jgi:predicted NBD/HSP70 family sugar kinase
VVAKLDERNRCRSASALVRTVRACADRTLAEATLRPDEVVTTVVGTPGVPDRTSRTLHRAPNLPGWDRKGLLGELEATLGAGLVVENDANLCAVGEHQAGAARGVDVFVCVTVGTGTGIGIGMGMGMGMGMGTVVNGELFRGAHGAAARSAISRSAGRCADCPRPVTRRHRACWNRRRPARWWRSRSATA